MTVTDFLRNVSKRLINFTGSLYAEVVAIIPYDSSEAELFTSANPGATSAGYKAYSTCKSGQVTVTTAGTAVQGDDEDGSLFVLKAHPDNTDTAWVGYVSDDVAAANGLPLDPGEAIALNIANLNQLYFDTDQDGEKICWLKLA
jgi:hypothetical protein